MADLATIVSHLETLLRHHGFPDYAQAFNGLQLENSGKVGRVATAVDACESVIVEAVRSGATLLLVHHGLMWDQHCFAFTGARYRKLRAAMEGDLAVFASHLPLDAHPTLGNAAQLAKAIGLRKPEPFFTYQSEPIGIRGELATDLQDLVARVRTAVGDAPMTLCAGGPKRVKRIGVITGAAGSEVAEIARSGVDTFITGEGPHWSYTAAEELGLNVIYGGHYATETFGVKALAAHLGKRFRLPWEFIDHPSGL
jgi:dinuclear metal center YbgI/SA1388 family protein